MTPGPGMEFGPHWWETKTYTTAPFLHPEKSTEVYYLLEKRFFNSIYLYICIGDHLPHIPLTYFFSQGQVMYTANTGYVMTQGPGGVPVAVPMQAGGGMVAVQNVTPGAQGGQPQMVMVPVSAAGNYQPQLAQAVPAGAMTTAYQPQFAQVAPAGAMATGYQHQHVEMPPSYGQGQYVTQQNEQVLLV